MALIINIKIRGKSNVLVPHVLSQKYRFVAFPGEELEAEIGQPGGKTLLKRVKVRHQLNEAWRFVTGHAAHHKACNEYFRSLKPVGGRTLKEILAEGDITVHCLEPKEGHTREDLPDADTAGRDIAIDPSLLFEKSIELSAVLIHELAHVAGATTDRGAPHADAAEQALNHCLCRAQFHPGVKG